MFTVHGRLSYDSMGLRIEIFGKQQVPPVSWSKTGVHRIPNRDCPVAIHIYYRDLDRVTLPDGSVATEKTRIDLLRGERITGDFKINA